MDESLVLGLGAVGLGGGIIYFLSRVSMFKKWKITDGIQAFSDKQYLKARQIFEAIMPDEPKNPLLYWYAGRASIEIGEVNRGIAEIKKVIQINSYPAEKGDHPNLGDFTEKGVHRYLRDLYNRARLESNAFGENQILMRLDPNNPEYGMECAQGLIKKQEYSDRTMGFLQHVLEIQPSNVEALNLTALTALKQQNRNKAQHYAEKAVSIQANNPDSAFILGEVAYHQQQHDKAVRMFEQAMNSANFKKSANFALGKIYFQKGNWAKALQHASAADNASVGKNESADLEWDCKYLQGLIFEKQEEIKKAYDIYSMINRYKQKYRDVPEKIKKLNPATEHDYIKDFNTAKSDIFTILCEDIISHLGYQPTKTEATNDGNLNLLVKRKDAQHPGLTAVFIRRTMEQVGEDHVELLGKFMGSTRSTRGLFITSGNFSPTAKPKAEKMRIDLFPSDQLEQLLMKMQKR